jgi:hypothetical protein
MTSKRYVLAALLALTGVTLAAGPPSPVTDVVDSGTFTLYLRGERVGEERFVIREDRGGDAGPIYRSRAQVNLKLENRTVRINVGFEGIGANSRLRRYEAEINGGETTTIVAETRADRIRLSVRSRGGDEMKEFLVRGPTTVLDLNIAHHYFFALKLLEASGSGRAYVLTPRQRTNEQVTLQDRGSEVTQFAGQRMELRHVTLTTESGSVHHIWARDDKVMKVEVPDLQFRAERSGSDMGGGTGGP